MDRVEKQAEKVINGKDLLVVKKVEEVLVDFQLIQILLDGDILIFIEEFFNYNKGNIEYVSKKFFVIQEGKRLV